MHAVIQSERFHLCQLTPDHANVLFDLHTNPRVMRFVGMPPWQSRSQAVDYILRNERSYRSWGFGRWAVVSKNTNRFYGLAGLLHEGERVDLSYRFFPEYWGNQVATEVAGAVLAYGFSSLGLLSVEARVAFGNRASEKVLSKIGMRYIGDTYCMGLKAKRYSTERGAQKMEFATLNRAKPHL